MASPVLATNVCWTQVRRVLYRDLGSKAFLGNIDNWEKQNLFIQNIPAYSPGLNKIEILWRKIKYEWLDFSAYQSFASLKEGLKHILANIGLDYKINFT